MLAADVVPIDSHRGGSRSGTTSTLTSKPARRTPHPRRRSATVNPDDMRPPFDAVMELALNRDRYTGSSWVSINAMPDHLRTCLDRLCTAAVDLGIGEVVANDDQGTADDDEKSIVKSGLVRRPGASPAAAVCIAHGVQVIRAHSDVVTMLELRDQLHRVGGERNSDITEEIAGWLRCFNLSIPNPTTAGTRVLNVQAANWVRADLNDGAEELGVSASQLAVLAMGVTLADQPSTLEARRGQLVDIVERFYGRVRIRCAVGRALMEAL